MLAATIDQYGTPEDIHLEGVEKSVPADHEVLIQVHAVSINSWDWDLLRGEQKLFRLIFGLRKPKYPILGCDIAGDLEEMGIEKCLILLGGVEPYGIRPRAGGCMASR